MAKRYVGDGEVFEITLPCSEVCSHMRVAGQRRTVRLDNNTVFIQTPQGTQFSAPVLPGEAGLYWDADRASWYFHET
jgi:hypothetical protein